MTMRDIPMQEDNAFVPDNTTGTVFIRIAVPELKNQKCLQFQLDDTVWHAKQRILAAFAKDLRDALNYGMYLPPMNGRAGKFLDEERFLKEYPLQGPIGFLEFKYKRRVYKTMQLNPRKLKQLHSKTNLKHFLEYVRNGSVEKIHKMTNKGLDPNFHDQDNGETPLTVAVTLGKDKTRDVLIALVSGGAHIDFRNRSGLTAVHRAAIVGNVDAIKTLLDLGASPDFKDGRGLTPLYYSVSNDTDQACTEMLLHERAFLGTHDDQGWCEIHQACRYGRVQHLEHLLYYGAEIDVQNASGNTPLHVCAAYNQEACARVLLFRGADRSILNFSNQTAYQIAVIANTMDLADLIKNHKEEDVVPIRELPNYSDRRKNCTMTLTMRSLMRSRSDPRLHASVLEERSLREATSQQNLTSLSDFYDTASYNPSYTASCPSSHDYNSDSPCSLSVSSASSGPQRRGRLIALQQPCWSYTEPMDRQPLLTGRSFVCVKSFAPSESQLFRHLSRGDLVTVMAITDHGFVDGRIVEGREGGFPAAYVDEVHLRKAESLGDLVTGDMATMQRNTLAALINTERVCTPRMAILHKSPEGYGFVLRGAKSQTHMGNLNFQPTPEFPALQYLDSVDPGSQAERAGLKSGDFILEINGECVTRASHERVVQLIRTSGDVLALKVMAGRTMDEQHLSTMDWFKHPDGSRTLPLRTKKQAPLPPQRDPQTSLSYSKATSKSMSEGLAEIEKLDQTIAEFDQQSLSARRHSLQSLETDHQPPQSDQKVASVRAAHAMKRVSVLEMTEANVPPPPPAKPVTSGSKLSPAEMRIKKYHKKSSAIMERSRSTPDLADMDFGVNNGAEQRKQVVGAESGMGRTAPDKMSATWSKSHSIYVPVVPGMSIFENSSFMSDVTKGQTDGGCPDVPIRAPVHKRHAPDPPAKGEMVRINTGSLGHSNIYANISAEIAAHKKESPYESSFRPGTSAQLTDDPNEMTQSLEQAKLQHRKSASAGSMESLGLYNKHSSVSFAEDRIYETAQTFIQKHPNAMLLVTADIHDGKSVKNPMRPQADRQFYEPEPDYDVDSEDERVTTLSSVSNQSSSYHSMPVNSAASAHNLYGTKPAVTVISISKEGHSQGTGKQIPPQSNLPATAPKPGSPQMNIAYQNKTFASPKLESVGQNRVIPPSASSSSSSSRRSSVQSNFSQASSGHDGIQVSGREGRFTEMSLPSNVVLMQQRMNSGEGIHHTPPPHHPPPPPPLHSSPPTLYHPPPPPPPPPLPKNPPPSTFLSEQIASRSSASAPSISSSQSSAPVIPASDILAAVAQRRARMEVDGPRLTDRQSSAPSVDQTQSNQKALLAAIAQRRNKLEKTAETQVVEDIEARLNKNRKLQAAKYFSADTLRKTKKPEGDAKQDLLINSGPAGDKADTTKPEATLANAPVSSKPVVEPSNNPSATKSAAEPVSIPAFGKQVVEPDSKPKEIMMHKAHPSKPKAPPVPLAVDKAATKGSDKPASTNSTLKKHTSPDQKTNTTPLPKIGTIKSNDFLALAEKARQEYLQKISNTSSVKGVIGEGIPKTSQSQPTVIEVQPAKEDSTSPVKVSIKDMISNFENGKSDLDGPGNMKAYELEGVTEDHSHTEPSLHNGTLKGKHFSSSNGVGVSEDAMVAPPADFVDSDGAQPQQTRLDIIPPPPTFAADMGDNMAERNMSAFGHDDAASFVSSLSSLSTLSSEHGDTGLQHHSNIIAPPPPAGFDDENAVTENFIPPPAQFNITQKDHGTGGGEGEKMERAFQRKAVDEWQCEDVLDWLDSLDMAQYKQSFAHSGVDGKRLQALERNDYIDLGVTQVGHRMDLQRSIKRLILRSITNS